MTRLVVTGVLGAVLLSPLPAVSQAREPRFEVSGGAFFAGGHDLPNGSADLIPNQQGGGEYPLFKSETRMDSAPGFDARVGWKLNSRFTIEGGLFTSRPQLTSRLSDDVENAPDITAVQDTSLYIIEGSLNVALGNPRRSVVPFIRVGAGYLRQLHEGNVLVETGQAYHFGGGATVWFGRAQRAGLRMDARAYVLQGGLDFESGSRTLAAGGGSFVFAF